MRIHRWFIALLSPGKLHLPCQESPTIIIFVRCERGKSLLICLGRSDATVRASQ